FSYDDVECSVVKIIDMKLEKVVASTDCRNSEYCKVIQFPKNSEVCQVKIKCQTEEGKREKSLDLCGS
ncbi:MAG: hypothetical protein KDD35_03505, partial [Bdellovibrionales bacterium]|nr:hypothetical protein [Bdellovibrionales bacterium]